MSLLYHIKCCRYHFSSICFVKGADPLLSCKVLSFNFVLSSLCKLSYSNCKSLICSGWALFNCFCTCVSFLEKVTVAALFFALCCFSKREWRDVSSSVMSFKASRELLSLKLLIFSSRSGNVGCLSLSLSICGSLGGGGGCRQVMCTVGEYLPFLHMS